MSMSAAAIESEAWSGPPSLQGKDALILQHVDLVRRIAYHMMRRMPHSIEVEDLIQTGMVGLLEAAQRYEWRAGSTVETFHLSQRAKTSGATTPTNARHSLGSAGGTRRRYETRWLPSMTR